MNDCPATDTPGAKGRDATRQDAADAIAPIASRLRSLALRTLAQLGEATPLDVIAVCEASRESLQPRFSELRDMGLIEPTGARRLNPSGKYATIPRLADKGRAAL